MAVSHAAKEEMGHDEASPVEEDGAGGGAAWATSALVGRRSGVVAICGICQDGVIAEECAVALCGETQAFRLVFRNGKRNMHLQGGAWVAGSSREACVDLGLQLTID